MKLYYNQLIKIINIASLCTGFFNQIMRSVSAKIESQKQSTIISGTRASGGSPGNNYEMF